MHNMKTFVLFLLLGIPVYTGCLSSSNNPISSRETPVVRVVREYGPAVVNIRTEAVMDLKDTPEWGEYGNEIDSFLREYFGEAYSQGTLEYKSVGSGVIVNNDGLIVTNAHVVRKARTIYVVLKDGTSLEGDVVKENVDDDLAIIKVNLPHRINPVRLADSTDIMIGETAIAIGDPFGLENSVTVGVISGKDREFSNDECGYTCSGLLQTDASINPGNSGGALLNLDGELIGINLAIVQDAQNIGFAIPAYKIRALLEETESW